jgi:hypothetical protein
VTARRDGAQVEYADYWYRNKFHGGPRVCTAPSPASRTSPPSVARPSCSSVCRRLRGGRRARRTFPALRRFTDFTTDPVVRFLESSIASAAGCFRCCAIRGGRRRRHCRRRSRRPRTVRGRTRLYTEPVRRVSGHCGQRVTAVWGPPEPARRLLATAILALAATTPLPAVVPRPRHRLHPRGHQNLLRKLASLCFPAPASGEGRG